MISTKNRTLLLSVVTLLLFFSCTLQAQYVVKNPAYSYRETNTVEIASIRFYPDYIWVDMIYQDKVTKTPSFRISPATIISLAGVRNSGFELDSVVNVSTKDYTQVKKGSLNPFSLRFRFNFVDLFFDAANNVSTSAVKDFIYAFPLKMRFTECTSEYRRENNIKGNCFNFDGLQLNLSGDQLTTLYCSAFLKRTLQKDEFETTDTYEARTNRDSLKSLMQAGIESFDQVLFASKAVKMRKSPPSITYNSDKEIFLVTYAGVKPFQIKVPLADARAFKEKVLDGSVAPASFTGYRDEEDQYTVFDINFEDESGNTASFTNLDKPTDDRLQRKKEERISRAVEKMLDRRVF